MQIVFTCPAPLSSVWGGRRPRRGNGAFPSRLWPPPHPLLSQGSTEPFGQLRVLVIPAMGLCAGFAAADFKPICWEKIGLVYQPWFIVHILVCKSHILHLFPNCNLFLFFLLLLFFCPHKHTRQRAEKNKTKDNTAERERESQTDLGIAEPGYKTPTTVGTVTKGRLFAPKARALKRWRKITWSENQADNGTPQQDTAKTLSSFSLTHRLRSLNPPPPVSSQQSGCKHDEK